MDRLLCCFNYVLRNTCCPTPSASAFCSDNLCTKCIPHTDSISTFIRNPNFSFTFHKWIKPHAATDSPNRDFISNRHASSLPDSDSSH